MTPWRQMQRVLASLMIAFFALPFWILAQDDKTPDGKKDEKKAEELPLKTAGVIKFTTSEGTWMSVDVSSDGQTIVFDLLGDIYLMPVAGGKARRIIGGMSFESQPKFSPDGKYIAFLSDRSGAENIWLCKPDGSDPKPLTKGRGTMFVSPAWTSDSNYVIASKSERGIGTFHSYMYHKEGGSGISIGPPPPAPASADQEGPPSAPQTNKMGAVASPDGRFIYFAQRTGAFEYNARFPMWQIIRFDRETSETSRITNAQGSAMRPLLSPDGKHLVYATRYETKTALRVRDLETSQERWLINNVTRDDQESRATRDVFPGYSFMPDGKSLIVPINGKIKKVDFVTGQATDIPFSADVEAEIGPRIHFDYRVDDSPTVKSRLIRYPALSPDGKRVVFSAFNKLYLKDLPDGATRRLTDQSDGEFMPSWSPDGKSIAFVTWSNEGGQIYSIASEGGQPKRLTKTAAFYTYPIYTPDGSKIVFITGAVDDHLYADIRGNEEFSSPEEAILHGTSSDTFSEITGSGGSTGLDLRYISANGGDSTFISATQGGRYPHFANDSQRVYLTTSRGLSSVRLDGYDRKLHLKVTGKGEPPNLPSASMIKVSPDGTRAFVDLQGRHFLVTIPKAGKETVNVNLGAPTTTVPFKKMSVEGGDYLDWSANGKTVSWSLGTKFYRQDISGDKSESFDLSVESPRAKPKGTVVLSGAKIVTMTGNDVIEKGDIMIVDNRITAIGSKGKVQIPSGAKIIDVSGKTIIPGLVDIHAHMWPPRDVHQTQVWQYLANLAFGVTTSRDPQSSTTDVYAYADLVESGEILGPRVFTTGPGVFSSLGLEDKETVNNYIKRYKETYKTNTLKEYVVGDRMIRQLVAMACTEFGITPTTEGALDMKLDLSQMIDGYSGNEHALPIQPLYQDVVQFVAQSKTFYTPTILVAYGAPWAENYFFENTNVLNNQKLRRYIPNELINSMMRRRPQWFSPEEYSFQGIAKGAAEIVKAGGRVGLGGHGQMQGIGVHWELWAMQSGGMSNHDVLKVATIFGAEAIGLNQDIGSLETGKLADLIVLDNDPLADIHNTDSIRFVMKNGEIFEGDTLTKIWPVQKQLERQYWWGTEPK